MFIEGTFPERFIEAAVSAAKAETGAQAFFVGRVRPDRKGDVTVTYIEFTAQKEIAGITVIEIINESKEKFGIQSAEVWHSLGKVSTGKACFFVVVNGAHRKECFLALEYIVNEVKGRCPIFGKEIMSNGTQVWKENQK